MRICIVQIRKFTVTMKELNTKQSIRLGNSYLVFVSSLNCKKNKMYDMREKTNEKLVTVNIILKNVRNRWGKPNCGAPLLTAEILPKHAAKHNWLVANADYYECRWFSDYVIFHTIMKLGKTLLLLTFDTPKKKREMAFSRKLLFYHEYEKGRDYYILNYLRIPCGRYVNSRSIINGIKFSL